MEVEAKQISILEQMPEDQRREVIADGLKWIAENVAHLLAEIKCIGDSAPRASTILKQIAAEEAGKGFLLVDYLRPYRGIDQKRRANHLRSFYSHLSRGIYVKYYDTRPDAFREVQSIVDNYRLSHYLDGPNDIDWIFRNEIEDERERELYVDLVSNEGGLQWWSPANWWSRREKFDLLNDLIPSICPLFLRMNEMGLFSSEALAVLARTWKYVNISPSTRSIDYFPVNRQFLSKCQSSGILAPIEKIVFHGITKTFLYPLCGLNLGRIDVSQGELREERARYITLNI